MKASGLIRWEGLTIEQIQVAAKRTANHLKELWRINYKLEVLATNCYLQGLADMAECLIQRGYIPTDEQELMDYQI